MALTAAELSATAEGLRRLADQLGDQEEAVGSRLTAVDDGVEAVAPLWHGPAPDEAMTAGRAFLGETTNLTGLIGAAGELVGELAARADEYAARLAVAEATVTRVYWNVTYDLEIDGDAEALRAARNEISSVGCEWAFRCSQVSTAANIIVRGLSRITESVAMGPPYRYEVPTGVAYANFVIGFSEGTGISLSVIDPTDEVTRAGVETVDWLVDDPLGQHMFTVLEVMRQNDLEEANGHLSGNDLSSVSFGRALELWTELNEAKGLGLSADELEELASFTVGVALVLRASGSDTWDRANERPPRTVTVPSSEGATATYEIGSQEHAYSKRFHLFPDRHGDAADWMGRMQADPEAYFPFGVEVAEAVDPGGPAIAEGNVLKLTGHIGGVWDGFGHVVVIETTDTSFTFVALDDHRVAADGVITFTIREHEVDPGGGPGDADLSLHIDATRLVGGSSLESGAPQVVLDLVGQDQWSRMAAAFRCEEAYVGQEEHRRC